MRSEEMLSSARSYGRGWDTWQDLTSLSEKPTFHPSTSATYVDGAPRPGYVSACGTFREGATVPNFATIPNDVRAGAYAVDDRLPVHEHSSIRGKPAHCGQTR